MEYLTKMEKKYLKGKEKKKNGVVDGNGEEIPVRIKMRENKDILQRVKVVLNETKSFENDTKERWELRREGCGGGRYHEEGKERENRDRGNKYVE